MIMDMKHLKILFLSTFAVIAGSTMAQTATTPNKKLFQHLELGVTAGSTGLGVELAAPIGKMVQVRTGFSYMPEFEPTMNFGVQVGDDPAESQTKFENMSAILENMVGHDVKNSIDMIGDPNIYNWNVMVDVFPFKNNRHWHVTAGFFLGPSTFAKACNSTADMTSLLAVDMYNNMYDFFVEERYWDEPLYGDIYLDPDMGATMKSKLEYYGRMGMPLGKYAHDVYDSEGNVVHQKGDTYVMTPDENSMVKARVKVNKFKPYVGFGYKGRLSKRNDRFNIAFDAGVMMWGGTPSLITHDGTDLIKDIDDVPGKVGKYADLLEAFKVYPLLNLRITYRLF